MTQFEDKKHEVIIWNDIVELIEHVERDYTADQLPLLWLKAIYSIYTSHMDKQSDKNINLNIEDNRPKVSREEVLMLYRKNDVLKSEKDKKIIKRLYDDYKSHKGTINKLLRTYMNPDTITNRVLNPKRIVIAPYKNKKGEINNYFVIENAKPINEVLKAQPAHIELKAPQILINNLYKWKAHNYLGEKALSGADLFNVEAETNPAELDEESLAYFYISCVFRHYNYHRWWDIVKDRPKVIWHLINLLMQTYQRPFWRAAFVLQYADSTLFQKTITEFPKHLLATDRIKTIINVIENKSVERYISENADKVLYAHELLKEFSIFKIV